MRLIVLEMMLKGGVVEGGKDQVEGLLALSPWTVITEEARSIWKVKSLGRIKRDTGPAAKQGQLAFQRRLFGNEWHFEDRSSIWGLGS